MMYLPAFDVTSSKYSFGTITLATAGKTSLVITIANGLTGAALDGASPAVSKFWHLADLSTFTLTSEDTAGVTRLGRYSSSPFGLTLRNAIRAQMTINSWTNPSGFTITFSETTGLYTWAYPSATFSVTFSTTLGAQLCGFSGTQSGGTTYAGTVVPYFAILSTLPACSNPTANFEPGGIANHQVTDTGAGGGVSRYVSPLCRDWTQEFEIQARTIRGSEVSTHPFTHQHLVEHCRGQHPVVVRGGGFSSNTNGEAFYLRSEGMSWHPEPASPSNFAQWHIPYKTLVEGRLST